MNISLLEIQLEDLKEDLGLERTMTSQRVNLNYFALTFKKTVLEETGIKFSEDPTEQLWKAIEAVFGSWNNPRAIKYREINSISDDSGTAVNVRAWFYGNLGSDCATGVCFTRDPSTGEPGVFGEYLINAQGEDVVAGIRTPAPLNNFSKNETNKSQKTLEESMQRLTKS